MFEITHAVSIADANAHLLAVETTVTRTSAGALPASLTFFMPVWTPGSYLVREYARQIENLRATTIDGRPARVRKVRKNAWRVETDDAHTVVVKYALYANELTVRTNHVDGTHAYWNGAATYLGLDEAADLGGRVVVHVPADWKIATSLTEEENALSGGRVFRAKSFDELCDSPFECGKFIERWFDTLGRTHRIAALASADAKGIDWDKVTADTKTIVEAESRLLAGEREPARALPYDRYLFIWHVTPRTRGGLEHRDCTMLMARPSSFQTRSGYLDILSLIAHEFFHLWNVKRIRPEGLTPYRYGEENHTRMLWWFEGATSYYDWRTLRLAKLCTPAEYLEHLAEEIARLEDTPGARVHPLEEASFDAWIKAYRPDENTVNSTVSYYLKGEIVCALLDIEIRHRSQGRATLDDVLRRLNWNYGTENIPVPEGALADIMRDVTGVSVDDCFARWVRGTDPLEIGEVLAHAGLAFQRHSRRDAPPASIGARLRLEGGRAIVDAVPRGSAAHRAGIDPGDEIIAIAGKRIPEGRLELPLYGLTPGSSAQVTLARDGWLQAKDIVLDPPIATEAKIVALSDATEAAKKLYEAWLEESFSTAPAAKKSPPAPAPV